MDMVNHPPNNADVSEQPKKLRKTRWGELDKSSRTLAPEGSPTQVLQNQFHTSSPAMGNISQPGVQQPKFNLNVMAASSAAKEALEKVRKAALLQKQILEQVQASKASGIPLPNQILSNAQRGTNQLPKPLKLDKYGREIDDEGKIVQVKPTIHSTLKININRMKEEKKSKEIAHAPIIEQFKKSKWFDPSINIKKEKKKRALQFVEAGTYVKQEQQMIRQKEAKNMGIDIKKMRLQKQEINKRDEARISSLEKSKLIEKDDDSSFNPNFIPIGQNEQRLPLSNTWDHEYTSLEWWDLPFLSSDPSSFSTMNNEIILDQITNYVQHPYIETSSGQKAVVQPVMMYLTPQERKKLRRRRRQEKEREKQNKIRIGITPPPPPKVKLANLMKVLGDAAVADPSKVERDVQLQMKKRVKEHEERNQERKLNPSQRSYKKEQKWKQRDCDRQALLFTVRDLNNKKIVTKIDLNAKQAHLSGCAISCPDLINIVIVEGGPRSIKFFKKLMLRRLKWDDPDDNDNKDDDKNSQDEYEINKDPPCKLIWEGVVHQKSFSNWRLFTSKTESEAKYIFKEVKAEHYWDRAINGRTSL